MVYCSQRIFQIIKNRYLPLEEFLARFSEDLFDFQGIQIPFWIGEQQHDGFARGMDCLARVEDPLKRIVGIFFWS